MSEKFTQIQEQRQEQKLAQTISQQQLLHAQLVELPITQLIERVNTEMDDNPALEISADGADNPDFADFAEGSDNTDSPDDYDSQRDREDRQTALDEALAGIGRDDEELPVYQGGSNTSDENENIVYGQTDTFYDQLKEQMGFADLTEQERYIMEYLIGSLDDDGLLRKPLESISEELAIYHNIDATPKAIEHVLEKLQTFDPAGIGARSLQECLLLQIQRRSDSTVKTLMLRVVNGFFEEFTKKHWDKIQNALKLSDIQAQALFGELRKLNPKPGASMSEAIGHSLQQITPDFIIDTSDDGTITFTLNQGELPELQVSQSFADSMKAYQQNKEHMTRQNKEALLYIKKNVDAAQSFIEAIRSRRHTLTITMQAIIQLQRQFFLDGDEASLRPMILKDVAEKTGLDLSTISRVSNSKYAQTRWGTFPLRHFFSDSYVTGKGEELSTRQIKAALRDLIDEEDKRKPLSDDTLTEALKQKGFPIARRTVAKYREQLGIPVARLRK
jgi:RNA polymerase sigma-54 factor